MTSSELSKQDVAVLVQHGPQEIISRIDEGAYLQTVDEWNESRPDDMERLEEADCFEWQNAYWELGDPKGRGLEFEIIPGVEWGTDDDPRKEIADIAWEFVADRVDNLVAAIQRKQEKSLFSRQELRVYWLLSSWTKKDIKGLLDVSYATVRDYEERAETDIERAEETLDLTYDD